MPKTQALHHTQFYARFALLPAATLRLFSVPAQMRPMRPTFTSILDYMAKVELITFANDGARVQEGMKLRPIIVDEGDGGDVDWPRLARLKPGSLRAC